MKKSSHVQVVSRMSGMGAAWDALFANFIFAYRLFLLVTLNLSFHLSVTFFKEYSLLSTAYYHMTAIALIMDIDS